MKKYFISNKYSLICKKNIFMDYLQLEIQITNDFTDSNDNSNDKIHYII